MKSNYKVHKVAGISMLEHVFRSVKCDRPEDCYRYRAEAELVEQSWQSDRVCPSRTAGNGSRGYDGRACFGKSDWSDISYCWRHSSQLREKAWKKSDWLSYQSRMLRQSWQQKQIILWLWPDRRNQHGSDQIVEQADFEQQIKINTGTCNATMPISLRHSKISI